MSSACFLVRLSFIGSAPTSVCFGFSRVWLYLLFCFLFASVFSLLFVLIISALLVIYRDCRRVLPLGRCIYGRFRRLGSAGFFRSRSCFLWGFRFSCAFFRPLSFRVRPFSPFMASVYVSSGGAFTLCIVFFGGRTPNMALGGSCVRFSRLWRFLSSFFVNTLAFSVSRLSVRSFL